MFKYNNNVLSNLVSKETNVGTLVKGLCQSSQTGGTLVVTPKYDNLICLPQPFQHIDRSPSPRLENFQI